MIFFYMGMRDACARWDEIPFHREMLHKRCVDSLLGRGIGG